ncbi:hypothetical protein DYB37_002159 [Aphanomyces astaci]|uniref:Protein kinase domain-containing protein n=1 Tax=Aphanomyces astaci TaxID=112090 RepID=A0A3R6YTH0_APHAT|nr:hypothetical protein DYB35_001501 [Aphanomyces astaci]RHZ23911.1 hypothetical protein DYB37_002159 [Aphanomyces astaci]
MLSQIEANVRGSTTGVQLWPDRDFGGGVPVGEGIHACVKQVQMNGTMLAVKEYRYQTAHAVPPHGVVRAFQHEVDMLLAIHHDNIVGLVGVVLHPRLALVTEYMDGGSFGVFLWEVLTPSTCSNPFVGQTNDTFVDQVTSGIRPSLAFAGVYAPILDECWRLIPSERPSADTLVAQLTALLQ